MALEIYQHLAKRNPDIYNSKIEALNNFYNHCMTSNKADFFYQSFIRC